MIRCGLQRPGSAQMPEKDDALDGQSLPTHSDDGVDLTLIRWMLSMTPAERLQTLQRTIRSLLRLRDASGGK